MKTLDSFSKKIVIASLCLSLIFLSASLLVFSLSFVNKAYAEPTTTTLPWQNLEGAIGLGIVNNTGYFVVWATPNKLYKADLTKATDWFKE